MDCQRCGGNTCQLVLDSGQPVEVYYCSSCHAVMVEEEMTVCRNQKCIPGKSIL